MLTPEVVGGFYDALYERHTRSLTFQEIRRALTALSTIYVQRRDRLDQGKDLDGAGKRAAFALFYGPMHLITVAHIVEALGAHHSPPQQILDLGCGTGVGGAAWALACEPRPRLLGVDAHPWVLEEARFTWQKLGLSGETRAQDLLRAAQPTPGMGVILAYTVNELDDEGRRTLLLRLVSAPGPVLVVEPIAKRDRPWWPEWAAAFERAGGRADEWSFRPQLPQGLKLLDKAAGLRHHELKARTCFKP